MPNPSPPSCSDVMRDREKLERADFVGGVSDGTIGCAVMDYHPRGQVHMHRSWFMLDRVVVVTNVGVCSSRILFCTYPNRTGVWMLTSGGRVASLPGHTTGSTAATVTTSWDQRLLSSEAPALFATRTSTPCNSSSRLPNFSPPEPIQPGVTAQRLVNLAYLHHSEIGYVPLPTPTMVANCAPQPEWTVVASATNRTGSWADITQGDAEPIQKQVFSAYIDHGRAINRTDISTTYAIIPGISSEAMPAAMSELDRYLSVEPGWNVSALCFNAQPRTFSLLTDGGKDGRNSGDSFDAEHWRYAKSEFVAPDIGTTMMVSFWQTGKAANMHQHGCWNIKLSAVNGVHPSKLGESRNNASSQCKGASEPQQGAHCDLNNSRALAALKLGNFSACLVACCANVHCDCWTWTPNERGTGPECMLKQSGSPLRSAPGLWGGNNPTRSSTRPAVPEGVVATIREEMISDAHMSGAVSQSNVLLHISVSDPTAKLSSVTLELAGRWKGDCVAVSRPTNTSIVHAVLPVGADAGKTISLTCHS